MEAGFMNLNSKAQEERVLTYRRELQVFFEQDFPRVITSHSLLPILAAEVGDRDFTRPFVWGSSEWLLVVAAKTQVNFVVVGEGVGNFHINLYRVPGGASSRWVIMWHSNSHFEPIWPEGAPPHSFILNIQETFWLRCLVNSMLRQQALDEANTHERSQRGLQRDLTTATVTPMLGVYDPPG
jgi:hypothetical protein